METHEKTHPCSCDSPLPISDLFAMEVTPSFTLRPRVETVDDGTFDPDGDGQDNTENATAFTTKTALGLGIKGLFNVEGLSSRRICKRFFFPWFETMDFRHPIPETITQNTPSSLTQRYSRHTSLPNLQINEKLSVTAGRKLLAIGDHRFIGTVGWRQMPQTFGVYEINYEPMENLKSKSTMFMKDWELEIVSTLYIKRERS